MADSVKAAATSFISPGIGIVKSWQGIVELALRAAIIVLSIIMAAAAGACQSSVGEFPDGSNLRVIGLTDSAAGWLIFVAVVLIIYEALVIIQRFLNVKIINNHIFIVIIIDAVVSFVMAFFIFCAAVALAVYNPQWQDYRQNLADSGAFGALYLGTVDRIIGATGATSAFGFITMFVLIGKGVFMILGGVVFNWGPTKAKYDVGSGSSGAV